MNYIYVLIVLLSGLIHSIWNLFFKKSKNSLIFIFWAKIFQIIIYFPLVLYLLINNGFNVKGIIPIVLSGFFHFFYWLFLALGYKNSDLSYVYPISRAYPILITIFSVIFFKENLTIFGLLGIILIILGVYLITIKENFFYFFKEILKKDKGLIFSFLSLLIITIYSIVDKIGSRYVNPIIYVYFFEIISTIFFVPYILKIFKKEEIFRLAKNEFIYIFLTGIFIILSYSLIIFAMKRSYLSYIVSIRNIAVVFSVVFGIIFLKEKYGIKRFFASILIFLGIFLISSFG